MYELQVGGQYGELQEVNNACRVGRAEQKYGELICITNRFDLRKEIHEENASTAWHGQVINVLKKERNCEDFFPWFPGYSPKDHHELRLNAISRKQQTEQREKEREFQAQQRADDRAFNLQQKKSDRKWHWIGLAIAAFLGALFGSLKDIIADLIKKM